MQISTTKRRVHPIAPLAFPDDVRDEQIAGILREVLDLAKGGARFQERAAMDPPRLEIHDRPIQYVVDRVRSHEQRNGLLRERLQRFLTPVPRCLMGRGIVPQSRALFRARWSSREPPSAGHAQGDRSLRRYPQQLVVRNGCKVTRSLVSACTRTRCLVLFGIDFT